MAALSSATMPAGIIFPVDRKRLYMTPVSASDTSSDTIVAGLQSLPCIIRGMLSASSRSGSVLQSLGQRRLSANSGQTAGLGLHSLTYLMESICFSVLTFKDDMLLLGCCIH